MKATDKPVVICLHGSAANSRMWQSLRRASRGRCTIVAPELFTVAAAADDGEPDRDAIVACVLRQISHIDAPFYLVGHGIGGVVATWIAAILPERVLGLVLYEPAGVAATAEPRVPLRLITGTRSWYAARKAAQRLCRQFADATLLQLVGLRHMAPLTHPERVNPVILDYVLPPAMREPAQAA